MDKNLQIRNSTAEFLNNTQDTIEVKDGMAWLMQKLIAKLFYVHVSNIN